MKLKQEFEKATKNKQTPTTGHYEFYISNEPIFWTHNSEWKPDYKLFYEQYDTTFTKVTGTPVNFIDTFTISTVLDRDDYTMLKIRDTRTNENKIYYIQKTSKILKEGFEFIGVLDVWLTYGINFVEWAKNLEDPPTVLVNRFLSNRLWAAYRTNGKFLEDDEFFDYSNENYVTVGSYNNFIGGIVNKAINDEHDFAEFEPINFAVKDSDWRDDTSILPSWLQIEIQAIAIDNDYNLVNTNYQVYVFQADGKESKTGNFIPGEYVCVVADTNYNKRDGIIVSGGTNVIQVLTLDKYLPVPPARKDKIYSFEISDVKALKDATINNPNSPWANKLVGVFNVPFWKNIKNLNLWKLPKPGTATTYYHFIAFKIPQNEFIPLVKYDDKKLGAGNAGFVPTLFINIGNNINKTHDKTHDINDVWGIYDYSTTWIGEEIGPFNYSYKPGVYTQNGINGAEGIKNGATNYTDQVLSSKIFPYERKYGGREYLNKYALGRIKYWNTYLMPGINYLFTQTDYKKRRLLPNVPKHYYVPGYIDEIIYRPSGLGNGGGLSFTGSNFIWVNSHNGKTQLAISNPSMNAYISGWVQHLQANQSNMNTGLQIAQQQSNLEKQQAELNKTYGLKNADLQMAQGSMSLISGLGDIFKGAVKGIGGLGNIGKGIGGMGGGIISMVGAGFMKEQINEQYGLDMIRANNIYSHKEMEVNAALEDKRRSSKGTNILSTTTEADIMNKLNDYYNVASYENARQLFGFRKGTNNRIEYKWNTREEPTTIKSYNTDFMTVKAPLDPEGIRHYNRLTWNVGIKGNFYYPINYTFIDYIISNFKFSDYNENENQNNPFIYLNITIEPYIYRQWKPKATAEIITALEAMFNSGVRIWSRKPTYTNDDAFKLIEKLDVDSLSYKVDKEMTIPDLDNDDLIQTLPEIDNEEVKTKKKKAKTSNKK